ncbi:MAG: hypothetical protein JXA73_08835 [Acidobacteria bacterium]|nr:hypothetical protein [Acidobacteriota bacterium]
MLTKPHDPDAKLWYGVNWEDWLDDGVTIVTSTWSVPTGVTKISEGNTDTQSAVKVYIPAGVEGEEYIITNHIVASDGQEEDRSIKLKIRER